MKIHLHTKIHALNESFHKGELSLTEYRELRRKELDILNDTSQAKHNKKHRVSAEIIKRVLSNTLLVVGLVLVTVLIAKYFL